MPEPNMTLAQGKQWLRTPAAQEYLRRHPDKSEAYVLELMRRADRVRRDVATAKEQQTVKSFIARMKGVQAGRKVNGSGAAAVSDRTASLRNWLYDPTGRFA